jgi:hypothetical protein
MKYTTFLLLVFLQGCTLGPVFSEAPIAPEGQALVYLFRGDVLYGGGYATSFQINDINVVSLYDDGYTYQYLPPGDYVFKSYGERINANLEAGRVYYFGFHQENEMTGSLRKTLNIFKQYQRAEIQDKLKTYRYKESSSLADGKVSNLRDYKDSVSETSAQIRFKKSGAMKKVYNSFSVTLYDDPSECVGPRQLFTEQRLKDGYSKIQTNSWQTYDFSSRSSFSVYRLWCNNIISLKPEDNKRYTVELDIMPQKGESYSNDCLVKVIDDSTGLAVDFIDRTINKSILTGHLSCPESDLNEENYVKEAKEDSWCWVAGASRDC